MYINLIETKRLKVNKMTNSTKNFITSYNKLLKERIGKNDLECGKGDLKEEKPHHVIVHGSIACSTGYIYDENGNERQLYLNDDAGTCTICGTYTWEV